MSYRISGLSPEPFRHLFGRPDADLAALGVERHRVDRAVGFPDRIALRDCAVGDTVLLLNYEHQPADSPYRSRHAIFVDESATAAAEFIDTVPEVMLRRDIALRAFDAAHRMIDAALARGDTIAPTIERLLAVPECAYLQAHYAARGCYAARIERDGSH